ncbi:MAG: Crp/Fnr family transcriptional regulator [Acidiferrobacterales bacterium]
MVAKKDEEKLLKLIRRLPGEQVKILIEYAQFLDSKHGIEPELQTPQNIPRPQEERVIAAIKRLRSNYPMLDPTRLLTETSELMSQHLTQGRDATEVIDDLEKAFQSHYESLMKEQES